MNDDVLQNCLHNTNFDFNRCMIITRACVCCGRVHSFVAEASLYLASPHNNGLMVTGMYVGSRLHWHKVAP